MEEIMFFLQNEISKFRNNMINPIRTSEEERFYRKIVGINSYIFETKENNSAYVFDNKNEVNGLPAENEVGGLLAEFKELNTQDPDILAIMHIITRDIKLTILLDSIKEMKLEEGKEKAAEYQAKLDSLGIMQPSVDNPGISK
jgi:hypothetical protein